MLTRLFNNDCPRCRDSRLDHRVELRCVQQGDQYNLHAVMYGEDGIESSRLLSAGLTERECQAAIGRCVELFEQLLGTTTDVPFALDRSYPYQSAQAS